MVWSATVVGSQRRFGAKVWLAGVARLLLGSYLTLTLSPHLAWSGPKGPGEQVMRAEVIDRNPSVAMAIAAADLDWMRQLPPAPTVRGPSILDGRRFPRLWIGSIRYEPTTELKKYRINEELRSITKLYYNFQIIPQLRMPTGKLADIEEGFYLLRMVILRPKVPALDRALPGARDPESVTMYSRYITSFENLVQVRQGTVRAQVSFEFPYTTALNLRNTLLIQIVPVDPDKLRFDSRGFVQRDSDIVELSGSVLTNSTIKIPFIPVYPSALATPTDPAYADEVSPEERLDLGKFIQEAKIFQSKFQRTLEPRLAPSRIAEILKARYLNPNEPRFMLDPDIRRRTNLKTRSLREFWNQIESDQRTIDESWLPTLCAWLTQDFSLPTKIIGAQPKAHAQRLKDLAKFHEFAKCSLASPNQSVKVNPFWVVSAIESRITEQTSGGTAQLGLAHNSLASRSYSEDSLYSIAGNLGVDLFGYLRIGGSKAINFNHSRSRSDATLMSQTTSLEVSFWDLPIEVRDAQLCVHIESKISSLNEESTGHRGLVVCREDHRYRNFEITERYFHIFPSGSSSPAIDFHDPRNQIVNMSVRGTHDYHAFLQSIADSITPIHDRDKIAADELRARVREFEDSVPALPGVLSRAVRFSGPKSSEQMRLTKAPSLLDRLFFRAHEKF